MVGSATRFDALIAHLGLLLLSCSTICPSTLSSCLCLSCQVHDRGPRPMMAPEWVPQLQLQMLCAGTNSGLLVSRSGGAGEGWGRAVTSAASPRMPPLPRQGTTAGAAPLGSSPSISQALTRPPALHLPCSHQGRPSLPAVAGRRVPPHDAHHCVPPLDRPCGQVRSACSRLLGQLVGAPYAAEPHGSAGSGRGASGGG